MHVIITPLDYDCNLVTLQCRKGGKSSAFAVLGVCVSKVKTSRRNSLEPVCPVTSGFALLMYLDWIAHIVFKLRTQCQQQSRSLPPTAAWGCWRTWRVQQCWCRCFTKGALSGVSGSQFGSCESPASSPQTFMEQPEFGSHLC